MKSFPFFFFILTELFFQINLQNNSTAQEIHASLQEAESYNKSHTFFFGQTFHFYRKSLQILILNKDLWICKQYNLQQTPREAENLWKPPVDCLNGDYPTSILSCFQIVFPHKNKL